jgi:hypothetical protein
MTKIITRVYDSAEQARLVRHELIEMQKFSPRIVEIYASADGLTDALIEAHVQGPTAKEYEKHVAKGGAVVLVRAGYRPLGVAQTTRDVAEEMGAIDMGDLVEEVYLKDAPERFSNSLMLDHPRLLTRNRVPGSTTYHMANWPIPLISRRKPSSETTIMHDTYMANFPIPLISRRKPMDDFSNARHGHVLRLGSLISRRKPSDRFAFPRHAHMANFPLPLISKRKPNDRTAIGRHTRMANWPFPLLINGEPGTNSLIPGQPYMARFPFDHLIPGHKHQAGFPFGHIVPGHKHQANFPIPLISKRKPADPYAFPRHAHMADFILPLVTKSSEEKPDGDKRWSFSRMLGLPTLKER